MGARRNVPGGGDDGDVGAAGGEVLAQREDTAQQEWGPRREGASSVWGLDQGGGPTEQPWGGRAAAESAAWGPGATKGSEQGCLLGWATHAGTRNGRVCEEGLRGSRRLLSTQPLEEQSRKRLWRGGDPGQRTRGSLVISSTPSTSSPTRTHLSEHLTHLNAHSPAPPMTPRPHKGCTSPAP